MTDFDAALNVARQLSDEDRLRLIAELWDLIPEDAEVPLHEQWMPELERRVASLGGDSVDTVPWETIRSAALARIGYGR